MVAASGVSKRYITVMFSRLSEFSVLAHPYSIMPILSLSLVIILVFMKLSAALKMESMLLVDSHSSSIKA